MISLRPYQTDAIERVRQRITAGVARPLFVLPTGGGKTVVASEIIRSAVAMTSRVLFVAHRRELLKQTLAKLLRSGLPVSEIGVVMAGVPDAKSEWPLDLSATDSELWERHGRRRPAARVQIASIDTLRNRALPLADLVIVDEAHRALAPSYVTLQTSYPNAVHLGLTATPVRGDGKGLRASYDEIIEVATVAELIAMGFLVQPKSWTVPVLPDMVGARTTGGDYNAADLEKRVNTGALVGDIVEHWLKRAEGRRTVCFAVSVAHSQEIVRRFQARGIAAEHLDGETPTDERDAILARLASGQTVLVSNVGVLTEGWDCPSVKCLILARPTKSLGLCFQMAGRILRPWQGVSAVILDHAGCLLEHGEPHEPQPWSLDGCKKKRKSAKSNDCAKMCPQCFAVLALGVRVCPECLAEQPYREPLELAEAPGELVEALGLSVKFNAQWSALVEKWRAENVRRMADPNGRPVKPGAIFHQWRKRYGRPPPRGVKMPKLSAEESARIDEIEAKKATATISDVTPIGDPDVSAIHSVLFARAPEPARRRVAW